MSRALVVLPVALLVGAWALIDLLVHESTSTIRRAWRRWRGSHFDRYWGLGSYNPDTVSDALTAAGSEARTGCPCEGCERIWATVADLMFQVTEDDIAELNRIGIAWETS